MSNATLQQPLQQYGDGEALALALKEYSGTVLSKYYPALRFTPHVWTMPCPQGTNTLQFPAIAHSEGEELNAGVDRSGSNQPESEERLVILDTKQLIADHYQAEIDQFVTHFEFRSRYAEADAFAVASMVDQRVSAMIALGARQAARGTGVDAFPAGVRKLADTAGAITAAYPVSLAGSKRLQADFGYMRQQFLERNIAEGSGMTAFVSPYLDRVLAQDNTLMSHEFQDMNTLLTRKVRMVEGFMVEVSNNSVFQTNWSAYAQARYQGDFTKTIAVFTASPDAVGRITAMGDVRPFGPEWIPTKHSWYFGAKIWQGCKWLRPEACGELYLQ
jgi:hypothetical protein